VYFPDLGVVTPSVGAAHEFTKYKSQREYKTRRPWEWVWLVAQGRAFGKGSASLESIDEWGERMAADAF
jgi:hypothetical protein